MVLMESLNLELGSDIIDFDLMGTDDRKHDLSHFERDKVLVIIFMCNHCPYVQAIWQRLGKLQSRFGGRGVQLIGINPNMHPDYPEETLEKMKEYEGKYHMNFPYLIDETQEVAKAYKAQCTPDIYVYGEERKLAYHGRLDDNWKDPDSVTKEDLAEAIEALLDDELPDLEQKPSMGCSIKWRD